MCNKNHLTFLIVIICQFYSFSSMKIEVEERAELTDENPPITLIERWVNSCFHRQYCIAVSKSEIIFLLLLLIIFYLGMSLYFLREHRILLVKKMLLFLLSMIIIYLKYSLKCDIYYDIIIDAL